jgi:AcrR family transcriptional regulator
VVTSKASSEPSGDPRVRRTHAMLQRALIDLVDEQDLPRISVADVAESAGVSRSTFYDHYRDVHELAEAASTAMIDDVIDSLPSPGDLSSGPEPEEAEVALRDFFANFAAHANLYRRLLGPQGSARVIDHIRRRTTAGIHFIRHPEEAADFAARSADAPDTPHDVSAAFGAGALVGVAVDWLQRGCPGTAEEMAALTSPLFNILDGYDAQSPSRCADAKP